MKHAHGPIAIDVEEAPPLYGETAGAGVRAIAERTGRSPSTISRELRRYRDPDSGQYRPFTAHKLAGQRRARPRPGKIAANPVLRQFVADRLEKRWGPQQVSRARTAADAPRAGWRKTAAEQGKHLSGTRPSDELNCADLVRLAVRPGVSGGRCLGGPPAARRAKLSRGRRSALAHQWTAVPNRCPTP